MAILNIWSQRNANVVEATVFNYQIKGFALPWIWLTLNVLPFREYGIYTGIGFVTGYICYFFKFAYPEQYGGKCFINAPNFL